MDAKANKFKKLFSKSREKILKVIMQKYKQVLKRKPLTNPEETKDSGSDYPSSNSSNSPTINHKDYTGQKIKIDDAAIEKQHRQDQVSKMMGTNYPHLASSYINGEITLAQLKQSYYYQAKKIEYTCYDNMKELLKNKNQDKSNQIIRECYRAIPNNQGPTRRRPQSASWNYNTKLNKNYESTNVTSSIFNDTEKSVKDLNSTKIWNSSVKADPNLITDECRKVHVTNDRKERPSSSILYGGRLSAKAMHDILVESLYPEKKIPITCRKVSNTCRQAMKKAAERVKSYRSSSHSMSISMLGKPKKSKRSMAEVRDIIYLS